MNLALFACLQVNGEGSDLWLELLVENMGRVFMTHDFKHNLQVGAMLLCMLLPELDTPRCVATRSPRDLMSNLHQELRGLESVRAIPGSVPIHGWEMYPFEFDKEYVLGKLASSTCWMAANGGVGTSRPRSGGISHPVGQPVVYRGTFYVPEDPTVPVCDQRIDTGLLFGNKQQPMWNKGAVFVNGFNLGRFWTAKGPQRTLYLPSPLLRRGENHLVLLELHSYDGHPMGRPSVELLAD